MTQDEIKQLVETTPVVLFMKGTPDFPQCGFSARAVKILNTLGVEFQSRDVLENDQLRTNIKAYTNWPTIPQLYVKGEFVGGSDIMVEMFKSGELRQLMEEKNVELDQSNG